MSVLASHTYKFFIAILKSRNETSQKSHALSCLTEWSPLLHSHELLCCLAVMFFSWMNDLPVWK